MKIISIYMYVYSSGAEAVNSLGSKVLHNHKSSVNYSFAAKIPMKWLCNSFPHSNAQETNLTLP